MINLLRSQPRQIEIQNSRGSFSLHAKIRSLTLIKTRGAPYLAQSTHGWLVGVEPQHNTVWCLWCGVESMSPPGCVFLPQLSANSFWSSICCSNAPRVEPPTACLGNEQRGLVSWSGGRGRKRGLFSRFRLMKLRRGGPAARNMRGVNWVPYDGVTFIGNSQIHTQDETWAKHQNTYES